jgi:hypothetical protein
MDALIDFVLGNLAGLFCILLGIGLILYSCFAKRISFEGDVAVKPEERKLYEQRQRCANTELLLECFRCSTDSIKRPSR